jgi:hypothetical protein
MSVWLRHGVPAELDAAWNSGAVAQVTERAVQGDELNPGPATQSVGEQRLGGGWQAARLDGRAGGGVIGAQLCGFFQRVLQLLRIVSVGA